MQKIVGTKISCETVGQLLDIIKDIDPKLRVGGKFAAPLEVSLFEDDRTGEQILSVEEE